MGARGGALAFPFSTPFDFSLVSVLTPSSFLVSPRLTLFTPFAISASSFTGLGGASFQINLNIKLVIFVIFEVYAKFSLGLVVSETHVRNLLISLFLGHQPWLHLQRDTRL